MPDPSSPSHPTIDKIKRRNLCGVTPLPDGQLPAEVKNRLSHRLQALKNCATGGAGGDFSAGQPLILRAARRAFQNDATWLSRIFMTRATKMPEDY